MQSTENCDDRVATLHVLSIEHKHGSNLSLHHSEADARAAVSDYVAQWWERELDEPIPDDGVDVEWYFESVADEFYAIAPVALSRAAFEKALEPLDVNPPLVK